MKTPDAYKRSALWQVIIIVITIFWADTKPYIRLIGPIIAGDDNAPQSDSISLHRSSVPYNGTPYTVAESPGNRSPIIWEQEGTGGAPFFLPLQGAKMPFHIRGRQLMENRPQRPFIIVL